VVGSQRSEPTNDDVPPHRLTRLNAVAISNGRWQRSWFYNRV